jgi:hypothetical protein
MIAQEVFQRLFTTKEEVINGLDDEAKILEIALSLGQENTSTIRSVALLAYDEEGGDPSVLSAQALRDAFAANTTIKKLKIYALSSHVLSILLEGVAASRSIKKLYLYSCPNISAQDITALSNLDKLTFDGCRLGIETEAALARALKSGGTLQVSIIP